jgi:hypothetical protein
MEDYKCSMLHTENFGTFFPPSSAKHKSTFMSDGSVYDIYQDVLIAQPSIDGDYNRLLPATYA